MPTRQVEIAGAAHVVLDSRRVRHLDPHEGSGSVLVGTHHPGIDRDRPLRAFGMVGVAAQLIEDPGPGSITRPASMPVIDGLPVSIDRRQVPPGQATAGSPEHPVEHGPVISPPPALTRLAGQQRLQPGPLLVGQIMAIQHGPGLQHPPTMIYGTRSSRGGSDPPGQGQ
jgi:hypothetical protein